MVWRHIIEYFVTSLCAHIFFCRCITADSLMLSCLTLLVIRFVRRSTTHLVYLFIKANKAVTCILVYNKSKCIFVFSLNYPACKWYRVWLQKIVDAEVDKFFQVSTALSVLTSLIRTGADMVLLLRGLLLSGVLSYFMFWQRHFCT